MDRRRLVEHLQNAEQYLRQGEEHIASVRAHLGWLRSRGASPKVIEDLLQTLERTQQLHIEYRDRLLKELASHDES